MDQAQANQIAMANQIASQLARIANALESIDRELRAQASARAFGPPK